MTTTGETVTANDQDSIRIKLEPGYPSDEMIKLRISPESKYELAELLEAEGFHAGEIIELSAGGDLAILGIQAIAAGGGMVGLAAVLSAFFGKNKHKKVTVTVGNTTVEVQGMSDEKSKKTMCELLGRVAQQQRELDESWERVQREWNERQMD